MLCKSTELLCQHMSAREVRGRRVSDWLSALYDAGCLLDRPAFESA